MDLRICATVREGMFMDFTLSITRKLLEIIDTLSTKLSNISSLSQSNDRYLSALTNYNPINYKVATTRVYTNRSPSSSPQISVSNKWIKAVWIYRDRYSVLDSYSLKMNGIEVSNIDSLGVAMGTQVDIFTGCVYCENCTLQVSWEQNSTYNGGIVMCIEYYS